MRYDYIAEAQRAVSDHNKDTRSYADKTKAMIDHLTKVRDKVTAEIDRLQRMEQALGQLASENGAEDLRKHTSAPQAPRQAPGGIVDRLKANNPDFGGDELDEDLEGALARGLSGKIGG